MSTAMDQSNNRWKIIFELSPCDGRRADWECWGMQQLLICRPANWGPRGRATSTEGREKMWFESRASPDGAPPPKRHQIRLQPLE